MENFEQLKEAFTGLTPEEQRQFVIQFYGIMPIPIPCQLVYTKSDGNCEMLDCLLLDKKSEITGIVLGYVEVSLSHEEGGNFKHAHDVANAKGHCWRLPRHELGESGPFYFGKEKFNETVDILNQNGVKAEKWKEGWYWFSETFDDVVAFAFDVNNGRVGRNGKGDNDMFVRLVRTLPL